MLNAVKQWATAKWQWFAAWWQNASIAWQFYAAGLIATFVSGTAGMLGLPIHVASIALLISLTIFCAGLVIEAYLAVVHFINTKIGALIGLLIGAMTTAASLGYAFMIVNEAVGVIPSPFTYTVSFMGPLVGVQLLPFAILALGTVLMVVLAVIGVVGPFFMLAARSPAHRSAVDRQFGIWLMRFMAFTVLLGWTMGFMRNYATPYHHLLVKTAESFAWHLEMSAYDPCARPGEHIARLDDSVILVGQKMKDGFDFATRECVLSEQIKIK